MALINCSECSRELSDRAGSCPHCGCPADNKSPDFVLCLDCNQKVAINDEVCPNCGLFNSQKYKGQPHPVEVEPVRSIDNSVSCPKCGVKDAFTAQKRGYSLITGIFGMNKIVITCLKCGHKWRPGK